MLFETVLGVVSGMDESYLKPALVSACLVAALCSRKGALRAR